MPKPIIITKKDILMLERYAYLLRIAWINPSDKDAQLAVHKFENWEYTERLKPFLERWQKEFYSEIKTPKYIFKTQK